jgi:hypothetical protein
MVKEQKVPIKIKGVTFCFLICAIWERLTPHPIVVTPAHAHMGGGGGNDAPIAWATAARPPPMSHHLLTPLRN